MLQMAHDGGARAIGIAVPERGHDLPMFFLIPEPALGRHDAVFELAPLGLLVVLR